MSARARSTQTHERALRARAAAAAQATWGLGATRLEAAVAARVDRVVDRELVCCVRVCARATSEREASGGRRRQQRERVRRGRATTTQPVRHDESSSLRVQFSAVSHAVHTPLVRSLSPRAPRHGEKNRRRLLRRLARRRCPCPPFWCCRVRGLVSPSSLPSSSAESARPKKNAMFGTNTQQRRDARSSASRPASSAGRPHGADYYSTIASFGTTPALRARERIARAPRERQRRCG